MTAEEELFELQRCGLAVILPRQRRTESMTAEGQKVQLQPVESVTEPGAAGVTAGSQEGCADRPASVGAAGETAASQPADIIAELLDLQRCGHFGGLPPPMSNNKRP